MLKFLEALKFAELVHVHNKPFNIHREVCVLCVRWMVECEGEEKGVKSEVLDERWFCVC